MSHAQEPSQMKGRVPLDMLFEPSNAIHSIEKHINASGQPETLPEFIEAMRRELHKLDDRDDRIIEVIGAHPRLGAKRVDSVQSKAEQKSLGESSEALIAANELYENTFPGLRYVVFVAGRSRAEVLQDLHARVAEGNYKLEVTRAIDAICDIALDRARKLK